MSTAVGPAATAPWSGSALPAPTAPRLRRPSWRDPRLLVGLLLVLAAVVLGSRVVAAADETAPYYAAAVALTPGEELDAADVQVVRARLPDARGPHLSATGDLPSGLVAVRPVSAGELLTRDDLGSARDVLTQPVGVPVDGALPRGLVEGARVDVWVSAPDPTQAGAFVEPQRVVDAALVAEVAQDTGALGTGGGTTVQVLLEQDALQQVLGALANGADVALVLVPGGG